MENFGVESEGVEGAKFHCSGCPQKITKESHPDLFAQEKESMQRLGNQDNSTPEESAERGLTIGFILLLCEKFDLWNWTTRAVLFNFVVPMTSRLRCRFVDLPMFEQSGAEVVGLADTFISHCNKAPFGAMVAGVSDGGVNLKRKIWIDIFAVRQWPSTKHDLHFETVISKCTSFVIICPSLKEVHRGVKDLSKLSQDILAKIPFFRAWCLYEVFYAAHYEKAVVLKGGTHHLIQKNGEAAFVPNRDMLIEMSREMNINTAETSNQSDKDMIFQKITDNFNGGVEGLNKKVKDVIVSAYETINYPVLHSAACGDEKSMAVLRESPPERYLENVIRGGYVALLKDIVTNDSALLEWQEPSSGLTPLMIAARAGNLPCVEYLLSMGANIDAKDTVGFNALSHARNVDVKECLNRAAATVNDTHPVSRDNGHKVWFPLPFFKKSMGQQIS